MTPLTTPLTTHLDPHDQLVADFLREMAAADDQAALLRRYQEAHPSFAAELAGLATLAGRLDQASVTAPEPLPKQLGEFQIVRRIGISMDEVFEAWQPSLKRRVAVKTIRRARISPGARERFLRQQLVLADLHQTHIVPIFAAGEEGPLQYFVMPYIDGAALHHVIQAARDLETEQPGSKTPPLKDLAEHANSKAPAAAASAARPAAAGHRPQVQPAPPALSLEYFRSVAQVIADAADALQFAHDAGILHRDLKPSNLMVDKNGHCWIIDFGLAGYLRRNGAAPPEDAGAPEGAAKPRGESSSLGGAATPLTISGVMGTPQYMAPEQWDSRADARTDVWGLGATLYELLALRRPFDGATPDEIKQTVQAKEPPPPRALVTNVPRDLEAICRKALHKDAAKRYATARALAEDLRRWLRIEPTVARPARTLRRAWMWARRNPGWAAALAVTLTFGFALAAVLGVQRERQHEAQHQALMREAQSLRLNPHRPGWSKDATKLLGQAAQIRVDETLRNEAATSLIGLDVVSAREFKGEGANSLAFHSSGKKLILGAQPLERNGREPNKPRQPIRIWDKPTDQVRETKIFESGPVTYDADNRALAFTFKQQDASALLLWDLDKDQALREFSIPAKSKGKAQHLALSANGAKVAAAVPLDEEKSLIIVWDAASGKTLLKVENKETTALALSADGSAVAFGDREGRIEVWSLEKENTSTELKSGRLAVTALAFGRNLKQSPQGSPWVLASGNNGGTTLVWDLADKSVRTQCLGSHYDVLALAFSPDGTLLASGGRGWPRLWNAANGQLLLELDLHDYTSALAFSPDGTHLALANPKSPFGPLAIRLWRLENGPALKSLLGLSGQIVYVEFSPDGSRLAALSQLFEIGVWDTKTGQLLHVFQPPQSPFVDNTALAISADNRHLAFTGGRHAFLWDLRTGEGQAFAMNPGMVDQLAFHPGSKKFLSFRVETLDGKEWPLSTTDPRKHPRVCRVRELSPKGIDEIGAIKDFNWHVFGADLARNASTIVVEGLNDDERGQKRMVRIYSLPDRKELWSGTYPEYHRGPLDPAGRFYLHWGYDAGKQAHPQLLDVRTGERRAWRQPIPNCLGPGANFAARPSQGNETGQTVGLALYRSDKPDPPIAFATSLSSIALQFNRAGTHFAWGTTDGQVILCDLAETQRRLAGIRLGW